MWLKVDSPSSPSLSVPSLSCGLAPVQEEIKMWRKKVKWNVNDHHFLPAAFYPRPGNDEFDMNLYTHSVSALRVGSPSHALSQPFSLSCFSSSSCKYVREIIQDLEQFFVCMVHILYVSSVPTDAHLIQNREIYMVKSCKFTDLSGVMFSVLVFFVIRLFFKLISKYLMKSELWSQEPGYFFSFWGTFKLRKIFLNFFKIKNQLLYHIEMEVKQTFLKIFSFMKIKVLELVCPLMAFNLCHSPSV